ncbi:DegT/DnrJ/EryC1/StrS family aminotransferase [Bacillus licheniformis]|nr:DegT/DnrJ/EryC1/StrS family aminotransferase [Bacillus licheniformis]
MQPGDEVIVSDFSFPATVNVIEDLGAKPVLPMLILKHLTCFQKNWKVKSRPVQSRSFVDALGNPTGITNIKQICKEYGLPLVDDAACAIGSSEYGCKSGKLPISPVSAFTQESCLRQAKAGQLQPTGKS